MPTPFEEEIALFARIYPDQRKRPAQLSEQQKAYINKLFGDFILDSHKVTARAGHVWKLGKKVMDRSWAYHCWKCNLSAVRHKGLFFVETKEDSKLPCKELKLKNLIG